MNNIQDIYGKIRWRIKRYLRKIPGIKKVLAWKDWHYPRYKQYKELTKKLNPLRLPEEQRINPDKTYMIISGLNMNNVGLFCDMLAFIRWVAMAEKMNCIPVIDMKHVPNQYLETDEIGKINAWEYYYKQPTQYSLEEAYAGKNVIIVNRLDRPWNFNKSQKELFEKTWREEWSYDDDRKKLPYWKDVYQKYFKLTEEAKEHIEQIYHTLVCDGDKVLGLLCRGTDFTNGHPAGHAIQPTIEQIKEKVDEVLEETLCNKIFVATEDQGILDSLIESYGKMIIYVDCPRCETKEKESIASAFLEKHVDKKKNGMDYLASIYILAKCDCLIAGKTSATPFISLIKKNAFEYEFYWELGRYGKE